jgi:hypothetical protein
MAYDSSLGRPNKEKHREYFFDELDKIDAQYGTQDSLTDYHQNIKTMKYENWNPRNQNINVRAITIDSNDWIMARMLYDKRRARAKNYVHVAFFNREPTGAKFKTKILSRSTTFELAKCGIFINYCDIYNFLTKENVRSCLPLNLVWYDGMSAWYNDYYGQVKSPNKFFNEMTSDRLRHKLSQGCKIMITLHISRHNAWMKEKGRYKKMVQSWIDKNKGCIFTPMVFEEYKEKHRGSQWMAIGFCGVTNNPTVPVVMKDDNDDSSVEIISIKYSGKRKFDTIDDQDSDNSSSDFEESSESESSHDESSEYSDSGDSSESTTFNKKHMTRAQRKRNRTEKSLNGIKEHLNQIKKSLNRIKNILESDS